MPREPVTLFLAGDVMTARGIDQILPHPSAPGLREPYVRHAMTYVAIAEQVSGPVPRSVGPSYVWGEALAILARERPAASVVNLETSVTTSDAFWPGKAIHYRMHPRNVGCLEAARIDVCVLANNHVLDFGREGLRETLATLRAAGVATAGAGRDLDEARRPARLTLGDRDLWVFAVGSPTSGIPWTWAADGERAGVDLVEELSPATAEAIAARVRAHKQPGDLAVVSIHWGENWDDEIHADQVAFAHHLIDGGVDVVHGHSSHHLRPIEIYRDRLILYGCGDLVNDYEGIESHAIWRGDLGALFFVTLAEDGTLSGLRLAVTQMHRLRLERASPADVAWLGARVNHLSEPFGTHLEPDAEGSLVLCMQGGG